MTNHITASDGRPQDTPKDKVVSGRELQATVALREQVPLFVPRNEVMMEARQVASQAQQKLHRIAGSLGALGAQESLKRNEVAEVTKGAGVCSPKEDDDEDEGEKAAAHSMEEKEDEEKEEEDVLMRGQEKAPVESPNEHEDTDMIMNELSLDDSLIDEVIQEQAVAVEVSPRNEKVADTLPKQNDREDVIQEQAIGMKVSPTRNEKFVTDTLPKKDISLEDVMQEQEISDSLKSMKTGSAAESVLPALDSARDEELSTVAQAPNSPRIELSTTSEQAPDCARNDDESTRAGGKHPVFSPRIPELFSTTRAQASHVAPLIIDDGVTIGGAAASPRVSPISGDEGILEALDESPEVEGEEEVTMEEDDADDTPRSAGAQSLPARLEDTDVLVHEDDEGYAGEDYYEANYDEDPFMHGGNFEPASEKQAMTLTAEEYAEWVEEGYGVEFSGEQLEEGEQEQHEEENQEHEQWLRERTRVEFHHNSVFPGEIEFLKTEIDRHWYVRQQGYDELETELRALLRNGADGVYVTTGPFMSQGMTKFAKFRQEADVLITVYWPFALKLEREVHHSAS